MATAICPDDDLPGRGGFPATDAREVGVVHVPAHVPYLFGDRRPSAPPVGAVIAPAGPHAVRLTRARQPGRDR